jgi:hypothetical protein
VLQVHVELPPALQRPDWRFSVHTTDADCEWRVSDMISAMVGAELDSRGMARIEYPGACEVTLELAGRILDPSTSLLGEFVWLKTSSEIRVKLTPEPLEQRFVLHATPEEWAALESALRAQH